MTDEQIVNALTSCLHHGECYGCVYGRLKNYGGSCIDRLHEDILGLISRQKKEIAEYQKHIDNDIVYANAIKTEAAEKFSERLQEKLTAYGYQYETEDGFVLDVYLPDDVFRFIDDVENEMRGVAYEKKC